MPLFQALPMSNAKNQSITVIELVATVYDSSYELTCPICCGSLRHVVLENWEDSLQQIIARDLFSQVESTDKAWGQIVYHKKFFIMQFIQHNLILTVLLDSRESLQE